MKQQEIAKRIQRGQSFVSEFINGNKGCSLKTAKILAKEFGLDPLWWMESTAEDRQKVLIHGASLRTPSTDERAKT